MEIKKKFKTIEELWIDYKKAAFRPNTPRIQLIECKKVFFSAIFAYLLQADKLEDLSNIYGAKYLDSLVGEIAAFYDQQIRKFKLGLPSDDSDI